MSDRIINAERIEQIINVFGSFDENIKRIEQTYGVKITNRGTELKISGEDEAADRAGRAIEGLLLLAAKGETIGIIGGTGSGKSSRVNPIPRFYDAASGEVKVGGVNVKDMDVEQLREKIGVVPQKAVLFHGTIRENMQWGVTNASDDEIIEAIEAAQGLDVIKAKGGLDCEIEQGGKNLSGGQRQRLTIARALVKKPEILILDDSASALDFATDAALRKSLRELDYHPTVFIVSQRTSSIQHADRIIVLDDGAAVGIGTHDELMKSCSVYQEIYNSQFKKEAV